MTLRLAPLMLLLACAPLPGPPPAPALPVATEDSCNAQQYARLVGQDSTALERELILGPVRVIRPGMAVTMDFSPGRINFDIDAGGRISAVRCG